MKLCPFRFWIFSGSALFWLLASYPVSAQTQPIVADTTLPNNSFVTRSGNTITITGGTKAGSNLFHSFKEFSLPSGEAFFNNAVDITNIISRVTGGSPSDINGLIRANGTANLFLINPNGIIFGRNASLQIGGSFVASTADSLKFEGGTEFSATNPQAPPLLTVSVPLGLQFGSNRGEIVNRSTPGLQLLSGKTLALVGGNVTLDGGNLTVVAGGRIELGSVGTGLVNLTTQNPQGYYVLEYSGVQNFQDIQLSNGARVAALSLIMGSGGIQVRGRNINLTGGANIASNTFGQGQAGDLVVKASDAIELSGTTTDGQVSSGLSGQVARQATGKGGNLTVETGRLTIRDGARIDASTFGQGQGGNIQVTASDIELVGAGKTPIDGVLPTSGIFSQVAEKARDDAGNAGNVTIKTQGLTAEGGGQISAATWKRGNGGNLTINADSIKLSGASPDATPDRGSSGFFVSAKQGATGNVGNLTINTGLLSVKNGAQISADNLGSGQGSPAGNLTVTANDLRLNGGKITATTNAGEGGNITLQNLNLLLMENQSKISAAASGNAKGGNINIDARNGSVVAVPEQNNGIIASAVGARGGNITITPSGIFGIEEGKQTEENMTNYIDASSQFGLPGTVNINRSGVEPNLILPELSTLLVDTSTLVDTGCAAFANSQGNSFTITGRGGLPPSPYEPLSPDVVWSDTRIPNITTQHNQVTTPPPSDSHVAAIVPATGWVFNGKGQVTLISNASRTASLASTAPKCPQR